VKGNHAAGPGIGKRGKSPLLKKRKGKERGGKLRRKRRLVFDEEKKKFFPLRGALPSPRQGGTSSSKGKTMDKIEGGERGGVGMASPQKGEASPLSRFSSKFVKGWSQLLLSEKNRVNIHKDGKALRNGVREVAIFSRSWLNPRGREQRGKLQSQSAYSSLGGKRQSNRGIFCLGKKKKPTGKDPPREAEAWSLMRRKGRQDGGLGVPEAKWGSRFEKPTEKHQTSEKCESEGRHETLLT